MRENIDHQYIEVILKNENFLYPNQFGDKLICLKDHRLLLTIQNQLLKNTYELKR